MFSTVSAVPAPNVSVSVPSGPLYEGTSQTLTCTATLSPSVDTDTNVTVLWTHNIPHDRVTISPPTSPKPPYTSTLTVSPLTMADAGRYSCVASANSSSHYISGRGRASEATLTVSGMVAESLSSPEMMACVVSPPALPPPNVSLSFTGLPVVGQNFTLTCSAAVVAGLVVQPHLKIVFPNSTAVAVVAASSLQHSLSPVMSSHGGQYTCSATVNIPEAGITNLMTSVTKTVTVVCEFTLIFLLTAHELYVTVKLCMLVCAQVQLSSGTFIAHACGKKKSV